MPKIKHIPDFPSVDKVKKYMSSPALMLDRYGFKDARSMGQAFDKVQTAIANYGRTGEKPKIRTPQAAQRFLEKVAGRECCVLTHDDQEVSVELNCRSAELSNVLGPDGLVRIGRGTFKVDQKNVTLIDGARKVNSAIATFFREFGYTTIIGASDKQAASDPEVIWQLSKSPSKHGYRVRFSVTQYADQYGSLVRVEVKTQKRYWLAFIPVWMTSPVYAISIGGAFSGPLSPGLYKLPNPFNHVADYNVSYMFRDHWLDSNPHYQVDSCVYDCSVYPHDAPRIDADVWK